MDIWEIILQNASGVIITIAAVGLTMLVIGGLGLWLLHYSERQRIRRRLIKLHAHIWDGYASSEYYCWLRIRWLLEKKEATTPVMNEVDRLIKECKNRREKFRQIMLETGRPIRVRKTEIQR